MKKQKKKEETLGPWGPMGPRVSFFSAFPFLLEGGCFFE